tara:strand:- start:2375 stop:2548 length:174 start_codon:yes stop_codon:yes gene_type:complete
MSTKTQHLKCPDCGAKDLVKLALEVEQDLLKGGKGIGVYLKCQTCTYASPIMAVSTT